MEQARIIDRLTETEGDVRVLQKETEIQNRIFTKLEETVEKTNELTESIHRLISIHDEKIKSLEKTVETIRIEMTEDIKDLHSRITSETRILSGKIEDSEARILSRLEQFQLEWKTEHTASNVKNEIKKDAWQEKMENLKIKIESWKWFILGGVFVLGMVFEKSHLLTLLGNLLKFTV